MPVRIYAHLTWTTFARAPLVTERVGEFLSRFLIEEATRHGARAIELGVVRDHVHMLLELPAAFDVPRMVQGLKGASARLAKWGRVRRAQSTAVGAGIRPSVCGDRPAASGR